MWKTKQLLLLRFGRQGEMVLLNSFLHYVCVCRCVFFLGAMLAAVHHWFQLWFISSSGLLLPSSWILCHPSFTWARCQLGTQQLQMLGFDLLCCIFAICHMTPKGDMKHNCPSDCFHSLVAVCPPAAFTLPGPWLFSLGNFWGPVLFSFVLVKTRNNSWENWCSYVL